MSVSLKALEATVFSDMENMYAAMKENSDVSPALRYRLEGQLQLLLDAKVFSWDEYKARCEAMMCSHNLPLPTKDYWLWCCSGKAVHLRLPVIFPLAPVYR